MSITVNAIKEFIKNRKIITPIIVQVLDVNRVDKSPLIVKAKVSDTVNIITSIIKCNTQSEADSIKQYGLIKIFTGNLHVPTDANKTLVFAIQKFQIVNNSVGKQLGTNLLELKKLSQLSTAPVPKSKNPINHTSLPPNDLSKGKITPLSMLTQYNNKSIIEGVVISKGDKYNYSKGYLFNFTIQDKDGNELKCTCFEETCEKYFDVIQENETYYISKGELKQPHSSSYRTGRMIDLDCIIGKYTVIQKSETSVPKISNITPIKELETCAVGSLYSICGVVASVGETETVKDKIKRVVELVDQTSWLIEINFWNDETSIPDDFEAGIIIKFDNLRLSEFRHKNMSYTRSSKYTINPECDEASLVTKFLEENNYELTNTQKFSDSDSTATSSSFPFMTLTEFDRYVRDAKGADFRADVLAHITAYKTDSISYIACDQCKKKVDISESECPNCKKQCSPQHKYILRLSLSDSTTTIWGTMFDDVATKLLEIPANELVEIKEDNFELFDKTFKDKTYIYARFGLAGKTEEYQDQENVRTRIIYAGTPLDCKKASKDLFDSIQSSLN
ncbi:Replication factor A protein 1 [Entamoeba marina]